MLTVQVAGAGGVPAGGATAAVLNVTVTRPTRAGYLTVWPTGAAQPGTSKLNYVAGQTVANLVQVGLGSAGQVSIYNFAGSVDVVVDVEGYVQDDPLDPEFGTPGLYNTLTVARISDTWPGLGYPNGGQIVGPGATSTSR